MAEVAGSARTEADVLNGIDIKRMVRLFKERGQCAGCWKPKGEFRDELSVREYQISALCQKCQDLIFGSDEQWAALASTPEDAA